MNRNQGLTCATILASVALLAGCESLVTQYEASRACDVSHGGSQVSCDEYWGARATEAEFERRMQEEERLRESQARFEWQRQEAETRERLDTVWAREVAAANAQDHALIRATYPGIGSLSGIWCGRGLDNAFVRVEVLSDNEIRWFWGRGGWGRQLRLAAADEPGRVFRITHEFRREDYQPHTGNEAEKRIEIHSDNLIRHKWIWYQRCSGTPRY